MRLTQACRCRLVRPSGLGASIIRFDELPLTGVIDDTATLVAPGTAATASRSLVNNEARSSACVLLRDTLRLATRRCAGSKPAGTAAIEANVRTNSPAAVTSASDSAI